MLREALGVAEDGKRWEITGSETVGRWEKGELRREREAGGGRDDDG